MCTQSIEFACLHYIFHPAGGCASVRRGCVRIWNKKEGSNKGSRPYCRTPYWRWSKLYLLLEKNAWNLNANARSQSSTFHRRQGARTVWIKVENLSNFIFYFHYPSFFSYHTFYVAFSLGLSLPHRFGMQDLPLPCAFGGGIFSWRPLPTLVVILPTVERVLRRKGVGGGVVQGGIGVVPKEKNKMMTVKWGANKNCVKVWRYCGER